MRKLKLFFACLLMAVLSIGQVWAAPDESVTFSEQGYSNQQAVSSYNGTDFSIAFDKGTNSNAPKYFTSGSAIRAYGGNTMTISSSSSTKTIKEIAITFGSSDGSNAITTDVGTYSNGTWTGSASSVTFTIGGSSGNRRLSAIAITYATGGTTTPSLSVAPTSIDFGIVEQGASVSSEVVAVTFANLTGPVTYSGLSDAFSAMGNIAATGDEITIAANTSTIGEYEQTLTVNSAADALSKTVTVSMNVVAPFNGLQLTFPDYNDKGVSSYTATWTATKGGQVWTMANFNNYNSGWNLIKAGRNNNNASVATITTQVANPVESVVVTVSSVVAANVNSHKLYVADNADFTDAIEIDGDPATIAAGDITYTIPAANRAEDLYYKLEYDLAAGSGNGFLQISKLAYAYGTAAPQKQNTGLAYATANYLVKADASLETPTLTNPNSLTGITYASSDADVVAVDETTGALTIKAAGKAVITASRAADETYKVGSASYTVYVATEAGTAADPLTEASAKALIDLGCGMEAHVHGTALGTQANNFTVTLANGFQFYKLKDLGNVAFENAYIGNGDEVTAVGILTKYNTTYELADGCYLTAYTEYTEPLVDISNTKATAYTVAEALALAVNPTSDLTKAVYIKGVVYDVKSFNSTNGTLDIYIKDNGVDNKFEFYKCAGLYGESLTAFTAADDVQVGDEVIGYGVMKYYSGGSIWEFDNTATGDYLVELTRPEIAVSSVELDQYAASIEVNETVTLHATVNPDNASNKAITWSLQSGSEYASVADGVVTGLVAGEAVIRVASVADPTKYAECTVTVNAADPTKHVVTFDATVDQGESPLSKSNISMACSSGVLNNGSEYRLYKNSTTTFECSVGNITKIEFTGVSGNPVSGFGDPEVGTLVTEGNNGVWTGNAESVSFVASGAQVRATEIKVTYKEDTRAEAGLAWDEPSVELTVGDAFTAPTLTNPNSIAAAEITIASDNTALAQVENGVVSLVADATGEATITATFEGNDSYKPATVSYTITVNAAPTPIIYVDKLNVNFGSVAQGASVADKTITVTLTDVAAVTATLGGTNPEAFSISKTEEIVDGDVITISVVSTANTGSFAATIAISDGAEGAEDKTVNLSLTVTEPEIAEEAVSTTSQWVPATEIADGMEVLITGIKTVENEDVVYAMGEQGNNNRAAVEATVNEGILTPGDGTMSFTLVEQEGENKYALRTSNGKYLYAASSSKNYLRTQAEVNENAIWTLSATSAVAEGSSNRNVMQFNVNNTLFSCYASAGGSGMASIALYIPYVAPQPQLDPIAEIGGKFIINAKGDTAVFSRGNLQYQQSTQTWRCAPNQYDWAGEAANEQMGNAAYAGWVDLFSWSLGAENNYGATSAYLSTAYQNKDFVDWGGLFSGDWSTLSSAEWQYLLNSRSGANDKWGMAMIGDNLGMILLPNDWTAPAGVTFVPRTNPTSELWDEEDMIDNTGDHYRVKPENMPANKFTLEEWAQLEAAGAIFLPYAGRRSGGYGNHINRLDEEVADEYNFTYYENYLGTYWTSTAANKATGTVNYVYTLKYQKVNNEDDYQWGKAVVWGENGRYGQSVRLVHIIPRQYAVTYDVNGAEGEAPVDGAKYLDGADVTLADASGLSKEGYVFAGWKFKGETYNGIYTVNNVLANEEIVFEAQWEKDWQTVREDLAVGNHYTVCLPKNVTDVKGATFWSLSYRNNEGTFAYLVEETAPFDAAVPYVIQATEDKLQVVYGDESESEGKTNGALVGTLEELTPTVFGLLPGNIYIIKENALRPREVGANWLPAYRAYVNYDALSVGEPTPAPGRRVKAMPLQKNTPTGIDALNASETPVKMLIDGQIYILRGEKIYDATGRLVK